MIAESAPIQVRRRLGEGGCVICGQFRIQLRLAALLSLRLGQWPSWGSAAAESHARPGPIRYLTILVMITILSPQPCFCPPVLAILTKINPNQPKCLSMNYLR